MSSEAPRSAKSFRSWMLSLFQRLSRHARLWPLAAVVVGFGALAAAIVWQGEQTTAREQTANRWHAHTLEVLVEVGRFSSALSETQRGARGYLLTADPQFLSGYKAGVQATQDHLHRLRVLTADNPAQQRRLAALEAYADAVISSSEREVDLEAAGRHAAALALVRSRVGHEAIQRAEQTNSAVAAEEQRLLAIRRAAATRAASDSARVTVALAIFGAGLLIVSGGLGWLAFAAAAGGGRGAAAPSRAPRTRRPRAPSPH